MPELSVMIKATATCNLSCRYCYESNRPDGRGSILDTPRLTKFIAQVMDYVADVGAVSFGWQGGEPLTQGLDAFRRVVSRQAACAHRGTVISNDIQTNGTLIDDDWAALFAEYAFLVGLSLDGPEEIHDSMRTARSGAPTFALVRAGLEHLLAAGVDTNALCVVGPHNVERAGELYEFFASTGLEHLQVMPAMKFPAKRPEAPADFWITPEQYGRFLCELFDAWYGLSGEPKMSVQPFDAFLQSYLGAPAGLCLFSHRCDGGLVVAEDGFVYPCDFHQAAPFRLGRIGTDSIAALVSSARYVDFVGQKSPPANRCKECPWFQHCRGGCPRFSRGTAHGADFFCQAYRSLFEHADRRLRLLRYRFQSSLG